MRVVTAESPVLARLANSFHGISIATFALQQQRDQKFTFDEEEVHEPKKKSSDSGSLIRECGFRRAIDFRTERARQRTFGPGSSQPDSPAARTSHTTDDPRPTGAGVVSDRPNAGTARDYSGKSAATARQR